MRMKSIILLASLGLLFLHSSAFVVPHGRPPLGHGSRTMPVVRSCLRQQRPEAAWLAMSTGSIEEESEMNALDRALVAWGVKSRPGEPEIDFKEKIKSAGLAGALAYGSTELAFWIISVPLAIFTYYRTTGEWLDLTTLEGKEKLFGLTAGFLTFARLVVPLRIALALALTPAMDKYVVKAFLKPPESSEEPATVSPASDAIADVMPATPATEVPPMSQSEEEEEEELGGVRERLQAAVVEERVRILREQMDL